MNATKNGWLLAVFTFHLHCGGRAALDSGTVQEDCDAVCAAWESCGELCGCMETYRSSVGCEHEVAAVHACLAAGLDRFSCGDTLSWSDGCAAEQAELSACDRGE